MGGRARPVLLAAALALGTAAAAGAAAAGPAAVARDPAFVAVDRARAAGLPGTPVESFTAQQFDTDRDGDQDLFYGLHDRGQQLFSADGDGTFTRSAATSWPAADPAGQVPDRHACRWGDLLGGPDSLPDVFCGAGRGGGNPVKGQGRLNELWEQTAPGEFREVGAALGLGDPCGRTHYVVVEDVDRDGDDDIFAGNAAPRPVDPAVPDPCDDPANGLPNEQSKLFLNEEGTAFRDVSAEWGVGGGLAAACAQSVDYDLDGYQDLLACRADGPVLLRNELGARFSQQQASAGLVAAPYQDALMGHLNGDAWPDLVAVAGNRVVYQLGSATGFRPVVRAYSTTDAVAVALGDADADGRGGDIYVVRGSVPARSNPPDVVLLNRGLRFSYVAVPAAGGIGDEVTALDPGGPGRPTRFFVQNGAEDATAPNQLIVLRRR